MTGHVRTRNGRDAAGVALVLSQPPDTAVLRSTDSDSLGRFRIAGLAPGEYVLTAQRIGLEAVTHRIRIRAGAAAATEFVLEEQAVSLPGVSVEATRERARFENEAGVTSRTLTREEMKRVPGVAEADVLRAIEMLPGVVSTSDYSSAFNVRGGSADENLILIDGFPIYNPFHLGGLFSVFNADMVGRAELLAGGFPAEYGGRIASVLNVESDAAGSGTTVDGGISVLAARAAIGNQVPDGLAHALGLRSARTRISLRRSYFDVLSKPAFDFPYHLTDLQGFAEGWTRGGGRVTLTTYTGRDVLDFTGSDSFPLNLRWRWGNDVIGLGYARPLTGGRSLEARIGYSRFTTGIRFPEFGDTDFRSRIGQLMLHADYLVPVGDVRMKLGVAADRLSYDNLFSSGGTVFSQSGGAGWLLGLYTEGEWRPGRWLMEAGARLDVWSAGQPGRSGAAVVPAPRLAIKRFLGNGDIAVKIAAGRYSQFLHSLRDEDLPLGIDVWVLAGARAPRIISDQVQAGVEAFLGRNWFTTLEAYDRRMDGVATNNFADDPNDPTDDLISGTGRARGIDFSMRHDGARLRPSLSVSLLRARRRFADPTTGAPTPPIVEYPPIFDRRVDIELALEAALPGGIDAGFRWNYGSGLPYTKPIAGYTMFRYGVIDGRRSFPTSDGADLAIVLGPRNAQRYPAYHRLDASFRKTYHKGWGELTPYLDVLNVYNHKNALFYFYQFDKDPPRRAGVSMFPFLPTAGLELRF